MAKAKHVAGFNFAKCLKAWGCVGGAAIVAFFPQTVSFCLIAGLLISAIVISNGK